MQYHVYNTGDQIWTSQRYNQRVTVKMVTHDGMTWEEGDQNSFCRLQGLEKYIHCAAVFCIKMILKVLQWLLKIECLLKAEWMLTAVYLYSSSQDLCLPCATALPKKISNIEMSVRQREEHICHTKVCAWKWKPFRYTKLSLEHKLQWWWRHLDIKPDCPGFASFP